MRRGEQGVGQAVGAEDVDLKLIAQVLVGEGGERSQPADSGVVDEGVEAAAFGGDELAGRLDLASLADVEAESVHVREPSERFEIFGLSRRGVNAVAERGQGLDQISADAGARAGDEDREPAAHGLSGLLLSLRGRPLRAQRWPPLGHLPGVP